MLEAETVFLCQRRCSATDGFRPRGVGFKALVGFVFLGVWGSRMKDLFVVSWLMVSVWVSWIETYDSRAWS